MQMRNPRILLTLLAALCVWTANAQNDSVMRNVAIDEIPVRARRILSEIGTQKTELDTLAMRDNITKSLADILAQSSSIFIKSYGRGTLATASFRGTAPSHTQVTWNDMKLNSPMLGMVDFSLIPSYFVDDVALYHGASSVGVTGGGLGGAIALGTRPAPGSGFDMRYIQGISSFNTYDQFFRLSYGNDRFQSVTRAYYVNSRNDFPYTNYRKKNYILDDEGQIVDWSYPRERNKNGSFKDFHLQQELYYRLANGDTFSLSAWWLDSRRGVPMLSVDYKDESKSRNKQDERTIRTVANWDRARGRYNLFAKAGYSYTDMRYRYLGDAGREELVEMIHSRSYVHTIFGKAGGDLFLGKEVLISGNVALHQNLVNSIDRAVYSNEGDKLIVGYDQARMELSAFASVRWHPTERLGLAANIREELYGKHWSPVIPAAFAEYTISKRWNITLKASIARNYRYPTLNDLYFMPGGNPDLRPERGFTYDGGIAAAIVRPRFDLRAEATAYDSYIDDWILWVPTFKGFWSPVNVKRVHSYGLELKGKLYVDLGSRWWLHLDANYTISKAINHGDPDSWADNSIGKQLVYIPERSNALTGKIAWRDLVFTYKYMYYSQRYTTSSNETATKIGRLGAYYMSDISLEKGFRMPWAAVNLKLAVNNLFDEEYESVLSRPMAGRNFGVFIEITPNLKRHRK